MANIYIKLKQYGNALDAYRESLRIREIVFESGTCYWDIFTGLFEIKQTSSELQSNIDMLIGALDIKISLLGLDHVYVALIFSHIAKIYEDQGAFAKATDFYTQCLVIEKGLFGKLHLSVAETYTDMAITANQSGNLALALQLMNEALSIKASILGKDHVDYKELTLLKMNIINSLKPKMGASTIGKKRRAKKIYISVDSSFTQWTIERIKECEDKLKEGFSFIGSGSGSEKLGESDNKTDNNCSIS
jgi:tetratricopeptide (TPR) repeat protein